MDDKLSKVIQNQDELKEITRLWAQKTPIDENEAQRLCHEAILLNHARYFEQIPVYRQLAENAGIGPDTDLETIKRDLMSTDDMFKSYNPEWLDMANFSDLTAWLRSLYKEDIYSDLSQISSIEGWISSLKKQNVNVVYSSGTSGRFSFIPKDDKTLDAYMHNGLYAILQFLLDREMDMSEYDLAVLGFKGGAMGLQRAGEQFAKYSQRSCFLYDFILEADIVRYLVRGPKNPEEVKKLEAFQEVTVHKRNEAYGRIIEFIQESAKNNRKIGIFGAPFQLKELTEMIQTKVGNLKLAEGSGILFGGGWKSFEGHRIPREELLERIKQTLSISTQFIVEGYSMAEINTLFLGCQYQRFHIPPMVIPVVLDDELIPLSGARQQGIFGFLDPYATSYPGFVITGDLVTMVQESCQCGLTGYSIVGEVRRAPGRETKGCGGVMSAVRA